MMNKTVRQIYMLAFKYPTGVLSKYIWDYHAELINKELELQWEARKILNDNLWDLYDGEVES